MFPAVVGLLGLCVIAFQRVSTKGVVVVQTCARNNLLLSCASGNVVRIKEIVLADSTCTGARCCPKSNDCTDAASDGHKNQVNSACNGRISCTVTMEIRNITCGSSYNFRFKSTNDYERITHECIVQQNATTTRPAVTRIRTTDPLDSDVNKTITPSTLSASAAAAATLSRTQLLAICITVPLIFLALIVVNICLWWRLKRRHGQLRCCHQDSLAGPPGTNNNAEDLDARAANDYEKINCSHRPSQAVYCALLPSAGSTVGGTGTAKSSHGRDANAQLDYEDVDH